MGSAAAARGEKVRGALKRTGEAGSPERSLKRRYCALVTHTRERVATAGAVSKRT